MRILLTGATSFTGYWFAHTLISRGHTVIAPMRSAGPEYSGLKARRLELLQNDCELLWDQPFGTERFLQMIERKGPFDLLCHHAAHVSNYKSPDFDALSAAKANSESLSRILSALKQTGCGRVLLTGSVFEPNEGVGNFPLRAFNPYGLSKGLTASIFEYYTQREGMGLGKFVIANPFGPLEEPRFTNYLLNCWREGKAARVNTPDYVRDNIHISLLALAYADFAGSLPASGISKLNPSYYVESQGAFAMRFAREIGIRLGIETPIELATQTDFSEPMIRINTDRVIVDSERWQEATAWDAIANYYGEMFATSKRPGSKQ